MTSWVSLGTAGLIVIRELGVPACYECDQPAEFVVRRIERSLMATYHLCDEHTQVWRDAANAATGRTPDLDQEAR